MACPRHHYGDGDPAQDAEGVACYMCRIEREMARFMPRDPAQLYWQDYRGWQYGWTTERMGDGRYAAFIFKPVGKGARTGKATRWKKVKEVHFAKRSTAKARAKKWMETAGRVAALR